MALEAQREVNLPSFLSSIVSTPTVLRAHPLLVRVLTFAPGGEPADLLRGRDAGGFVLFYRKQRQHPVLNTQQKLRSLPFTYRDCAKGSVDFFDATIHLALSLTTESVRRLEFSAQGLGPERVTGHDAMNLFCPRWQLELASMIYAVVSC